MTAFLPEIDSYFRVTPNVRLVFDAKGYMEDGDLNRAQIGPSLQFNIRPLEKLKQITTHDMDDMKPMPVVFTIGYRYLPSSVQPAIHRVLCEDIPKGIRPEDNELGCKNLCRSWLHSSSDARPKIQNASLPLGKFCTNAFWWIMVSGRLTQLSSRLAALDSFQFSLDLVRDKAVIATWDARKIRNGALGIAAESVGTAGKRRHLWQTRAKISLCWVTSTA